MGLRGAVRCHGHGAAQQSALQAREAVGRWAEETHLRNILQALQLVVLSNVYIWKLW